MKITADESIFAFELDVPLDSIPRFEKAFKGIQMGADIDKIHGLDPALNYKKPDVSIMMWSSVMLWRILSSNIGKTESSHYIP